MARTNKEFRKREARNTTALTMHARRTSRTCSALVHASVIARSFSLYKARNITRDGRFFTCGIFTPYKNVRAPSDSTIILAESVGIESQGTSRKRRVPFRGLQHPGGASSPRAGICSSSGNFLQETIYARCLSQSAWQRVRFWPSRGEIISSRLTYGPTSLDIITQTCSNRTSVIIISTALQV